MVCKLIEIFFKGYFLFPTAIKEDKPCKYARKGVCHSTQTYFG